VKWYKFSPRLKTLLIITFYRSVIPSGLTAGNIVPLSMTTYATVRQKLCKFICNVRKITYTSVVKGGTSGLILLYDIFIVQRLVTLHCVIS